MNASDLTNTPVTVHSIDIVQTEHKSDASSETSNSNVSTGSCNSQKGLVRNDGTFFTICAPACSTVSAMLTLLFGLLLLFSIAAFLILFFYFPFKSINAKLNYVETNCTTTGRSVAYGTSSSVQCSGCMCYIGKFNFTYVAPQNTTQGGDYNTECFLKYEDLEHEMSKYTLGSNVPCYYDPYKTYNMQINRELSWVDTLVIGVSGSLLLFSIFAFLSSGATAIVSKAIVRSLRVDR
jgi:hypothetical protein